ncbi:unnamed protein product [Cuscuta europaea]|uniref:RNase H type-1 domain-containing protein n=1 Tax=Cuscuta europaea TaxID=41803 RepID=A0A9P1E1D4_CUSEU|nr:unnamed protein product [Cuscuta europaea]
MDDCFPLQTSFALEAELLAILFVIKWMTAKGFEDFVVDSDSSVVLDFFTGRETRRWKMAIQETIQISGRKQISFSHGFRESNWVSHYLAPAHLDQLVYYDRLNQLPTLAKRAYWMDYFGIPSFRF